MDIQAIWIVVLAVSVPIGASIGFAIQLRQLRQSDLTNQKLGLELKDLKAQLDNAEQVIVRATPKEIEKYGAAVKRGTVMFARSKSDSQIVKGNPPTFFQRLVPSFFIGLALAFFS